MTDPIIDIKITGLEEVNKALGQFPPRIANKVLRLGAAAGARVLRKAQKQAAPVRRTGSAKLISWSVRTKRGQSDFRGRGFLKKNIKSRLSKRLSKKGVKIYGVGPTGDAYYGYILERGHRVGRRPNRSGLQAERDHLAPSPKTVPPYPFLIPTYRQMIFPIIKAIKDKLSEGIVKEGAKLGFDTRR